MQFYPPPKQFYIDGVLPPGDTFFWNSPKHAALRIQDTALRIEDNVSEWGDMSIRGLLLKIQLRVLV